MAMLRVFISSTAEDLRDWRLGSRRACGMAGISSAAASLLVCDRKRGSTRDHAEPNIED
jgi:hypothetical protein